MARFVPLNDGPLGGANAGERYSTSALCSDGDPNIDAASVIDGSSSLSILYSGEAPWLLCGGMQIDVQVPMGTPSGNFAVYPGAENSWGIRTARRHRLSARRWR
jgi:hypothetical protein